MVINKPPCMVSAIPADPEVEIYDKDQGCPDFMVCLSTKTVIDIANWVKAMMRLKEQLELCPHVQFGNGNHT